MSRIAILSILLAFTALGCDPKPGQTSCRVDNDCEDDDECTQDQCLNLVCEFTALVDEPGCGPTTCDEDLDCDDGDDCTEDTCSFESECQNLAISGCGVICDFDDDCDDGNLCTTDYCADDQACGYAPVSSPACDECEDNTVCDSFENCACIDCAEDVACAHPVDCIEIVAEDVTAFNEGPAQGADGSDLEGTGMDIVQAFPSGAPAGIVPFVDILDHDECFSSPGCVQLRINFNTGAPVEAMFTTGTWQHNADGSGEIYNATAYEYTQGAGGVMMYTDPPRCWHITHMHHEP